MRRFNVISPGAIDYLELNNGRKINTFGFIISFPCPTNNVLF